MRDLGLPKDSAELLGSRLKEKNLLTAEYWYIYIEAGKSFSQLVYFLLFTGGWFNLL